MNITDQYLALTKENKWEEALPLIEEIIKRNPEVSTSWFNYGVCLDELERYSDAAEAFMKAYEINPEDFGAQYRAFLSFTLDYDVEGFAKFLYVEAQKYPEVIDSLLDDEDFEEILEEPTIEAIVSDYLDEDDL